MSYAGDRVCFDADSHLMEEPDFLSKHADPAFRDELRIRGGQAGGAAFEEFFEKMVNDVHARMGDAEKTAALEANVIAGPKGWYAHGAVDPDERSRTLDLLGFHAQLVFSTFAGGFLRRKDPEIRYGGTRAHTRAMADFCSRDERLLAVAMIPLDDPARAVEELEEALRLGCSAIHVPSDPPGGDKDGFSPAHVDLEPFWARLAEARVPGLLHIGGGKLMPRAYHDNGRPRPKDFLGGGENLRAKDFSSVSHSPENFLTALVLDGVFERHPELMFGAIELGAAWVPGLVRNLDAAASGFSRNEPLIQELSLTPSDYIRRQVRFTPFPFEDVGWLIEQEGPDLFLFSSDYPHPEGGRNPLKRFEDSLNAKKIPESARTRFYSENFKQLMSI